jgi:hypothetical protein
VDFHLPRFFISSIGYPAIDRAVDLRELAKSQLQYAATLFQTTKIIKKYCPEVIGDIPKILKLWTVFVSD